jgi:hypothetical protein
MALVTEDRIALLLNLEIPVIRWQIVSSGHLNTGDVLKASVITRIAAEPVAPTIDLAGHLTQVRNDSLPEPHDALVLFERESLAQARDDEARPGFKTRLTQSRFSFLSFEKAPPEAGHDLFRELVSG